MGRTKPPRRPHASDTERRIYEAAQQDRFKHQPQGFLEVWANIFMQLQDDDGFDTTFHSTCVHQIMGTSKMMTDELEYTARNAWKMAYGYDESDDFLLRDDTKPPISKETVK